jgi:hypothetical protein
MVLGTDAKNNHVTFAVVTHTIGLAAGQSLGNGWHRNNTAPSGAWAARVTRLEPFGKLREQAVK